MRRALACGGERRVDARRHDRDVARRQAEQFDDLVPGRRGQRQDARTLVQQWSDLEFDGLADPGQLRGQHHPPHLGMHVVQEHHPGAAGPDRGKERHPVPDLDQTVPGPAAAQRAGHRCAREDRVPARLADHRVAVAVDGLRMAGRHGRAQAHVDAGLRPQLRDLVGVQLRPARLGVVEITPGQHVHAAQSRSLDQLGEGESARRGLDPGRSHLRGQEARRDRDGRRHDEAIGGRRDRRAGAATIARGAHARAVRRAAASTDRPVTMASTAWQARLARAVLVGDPSAHSMRGTAAAAASPRASSTPRSPRASR